MTIAVTIKPSRDEFRALAQKRELIPLKDLVTMPQEKFFAQPTGKTYGQSMMLIFYLMKQHPKVMKDVFGRDYGFLPHSELLTFEEIARVAGVFVGLGVRKIRLTGGEPLLRKRIERLVEMLARIDDDLDLTLTTNGALPKLLVESGWVALASALLATGLAAWAAGRFLLSDGIGPAIAGVLFYAMAELWRLFFFNQGIFHFLGLIGVAALLVGKLRQPAGTSAGLASRP